MTTTTTTTTAKNEMRDIKEIAKCVRADIKAAIASGKLPEFTVSVTIQRFSMGRSLTVRVIGVPAGYSILNHKNLAFQKANPHELAAFAADESVRNRNNETACAHAKMLESIVAAYNWDKSDTSSDRFHVNFYAHVGFAGEIESAERAAYDAAPVTDRVAELRASALATQARARDNVERARAELEAALKLAREADALVAETGGASVAAQAPAGRPRLELVK